MSPSAPENTHRFREHGNPRCGGAQELSKSLSGSGTLSTRDSWTAPLKFGEALPPRFAEATLSARLAHVEHAA